MAITIRAREFMTLRSGVVAWPLAARAQQPAKMLRVALLAMLTLFAAPALGEAQQSKKIPRLCFLTFDPGTLRAPRFDVFFEALRDLGYVDGQTITIDYLSAGGDGERFPALTAECLRLKADIIVVSTTPAAKVAKNTTRTVPIVMVGLGDPVGTGLVESLAQPGGNITGMSQMAPELAAKRLALLTQAVPGISRVLVLSYLDDPIAPLQVKALNEAAHSLGVALQVRDIRTGDDLSAAFDAGARERVDGLLTTAESMFVVHRARMIGLAAHHRLPAMYPYSSQVEAGGLMAYDIDTPDLHRRAAIYVDRILNGAKPSDLPVQQPTKFNFVINLKTAKALGLNLPEKILALADRVIE